MNNQPTDVRPENNINGENLMDMDQATLKEMGIKKIGDRVRIGSQAKLFRNSVYKRTSKRNINRVRAGIVLSIEDGIDFVAAFARYTRWQRTVYPTIVRVTTTSTLGTIGHDLKSRQKDIKTDESGRDGFRSKLAVQSGKVVVETKLALDRPRESGRTRTEIRSAEPNGNWEKRVELVIL